MPVPYKEIAPISKQLTIIIGLCVVGAMAFGLALSYYNNILFDRQLKVMDEQNKKLAKEIASGYNTLEYLKSMQYKDKYAKENLNRANDGERTLIIAKKENLLPFQPTTGSGDALDQQAMFEQEMRDIPVVEHWRLYLFEKERLEDLKKKL